MLPRDTIQCSDFIMSEAEAETFPLAKKARKLQQRSSTEFEQEHMDRYMDASLKWPPSLQTIEEECGAEVTSLSQRVREVIYFTHMRWPFPEGDAIQFIDANVSIERLDRGGPDGPWTTGHVFTLIGSSVVVVRRRVLGKVTLRLLRGQELLAMQGWSAADYVDGPYLTQVSDKILSDMSGNAFSGFVVGAIAYAMFAVM